MKKWMHKIEHIVDKIIPYSLILLIIIIVLELGFHKFVVSNNLALSLDILDSFIILAFLLDLTFKYIRVRNIPRFFRRYWLEIIAVFPFFLFFRVAELVFGLEEISGGIKTAQSITHTGAELEKEVVILQEGEKILKVERSTRLSRFLRPLLRIPRFFKRIPEMLHFYNVPAEKYHQQEKNKL